MAVVVETVEGFAIIRVGSCSCSVAVAVAVVGAAGYQVQSTCFHWVFAFSGMLACPWLGP